MPPIKRKHLAFIVAFVVTTFATLAVALPGPTSCLLVGASGHDELENGTFADGASSIEQQRYLQFVADARRRIEATFGKAEAKPVVAFLGRSDRIGPFELNAFGSTQFIGSRACVMIGSNGRNVDVVAHELMHAELGHRVGHLKYLLEVPTWFDEGLAMQVDHRRRYSLSAQQAEGARRVRSLTTASGFFVADDQALTHNYASAKHEVSAWLSQVGTGTLYLRLDRLRSGASFAEIIAR